MSGHDDTKAHLRNQQGPSRQDSISAAIRITVRFKCPGLRADLRLPYPRMERTKKGARYAATCA
jgi:hypothetical protein